jgi:hypothetical protein
MPHIMYFWVQNMWASIGLRVGIGGGKKVTECKYRVVADVARSIEKKTIPAEISAIPAVTSSLLLNRCSLWKKESVEVQ